MIEFLPESSENIVGVRASGKLVDSDYKNVLLPKLEVLFDEYGELSVLCWLDETFEGWDLEAAWDDTSFGLRHRADFKKVAVVGGPAWIGWCVKLSGFLWKGEISIFPADEIDKAWAWVRS